MAALGLAALRGQPVTIDFGPTTPPAAPSRIAGTSPFGRRITEVKFKPAVLPAVEGTLKPGAILSPENLSAAMNELANRLSRRSELIAAASGSSVLVFTYVEPRFELNPAGGAANDTVAVTLRPFHLSLPLDDLGRRVLPMPRGLATRAIARGAPPAALPANIIVTEDRVLGTSIGGRWRFDPPRASQAQAPHLRFRGGGMKSVDAAFYSADADLRVVREQNSGLLRQVFAAAEGSVAREPRGPSEYHLRTGGAAAGIALAIHPGSRLLLDARYSRSEYRPASSATATGGTRSAEQGNRVVYEAIPPRWFGFFRAAVWHDTLHPRDAGAAQRLAARAGYVKEIPLGLNQGIGLEIVAGAGQTWGGVDAPRRFYAGGGQGEFLYESAASRQLMTAPDGPLLRSLGKAQGALAMASGASRGGTQFWHVNVNIALPIPPWSRPLIPNETTDLPGPDGSLQTLKQILRAQIDHTGPSMLQSTLRASDRLSPDEAKRRATEVFDEIRPAAHFVIDQANVFAVKPLLMFDLAELQSGPTRASWSAAGAGLQLLVVTAKFEIGYMRTLSGPTFGSHGNLFGRIGFERLF